MTEQEFIATHPDGASLQEVGDALGITRQRAQQLEKKALDKLLRALRRQGVDKTDLPD